MNQSVCLRSAAVSRSALALLVLSSWAGCAAQLRLSVGPTVDTLGGLGFDVKVSGGIGRGTRETGVTVQANLGGGAMDNVQTPVLLGGMEVSLMHAMDSEIAVRGGLLYASRRLFLGPDNFSINGLGINFAVGGFVKGNRHSSYRGQSYGTILGAELQFEYLWGYGLDRGIFSLPFTVEYWYLGS